MSFSQFYFENCNHRGSKKIALYSVCKTGNQKRFSSLEKEMCLETSDVCRNILCYTQSRKNRVILLIFMTSLPAAQLIANITKI